VGSKFGAKKSGTHVVQNCRIQNLAVETWDRNLGNPTFHYVFVDRYLSLETKK
jgi:hypothetical protein